MHFLNEVGIKQVIDTYNILHNILFWVKDNQSRIVYANSAFIEHFECKHLDRIIGLTDIEFSPYFLARQYLTDDKRVLEGECITDRLELNMLKDGGYGWFSTSKRPLYNQQNHIIGSYGLTQHLNQTSQLLSSVTDIHKATQYIHENFSENITVKELADVSFISVSALERRFKKQLSKTPKQFINQVRLENARKMILETYTPIADIAEACGFKEHSYFSKQFKALFAIQPAQLRNQKQTPAQTTNDYN